MSAALPGMARGQNRITEATDMRFMANLRIRSR